MAFCYQGYLHRKSSDITLGSGLNQSGSGAGSVMCHCASCRSVENRTQREHRQSCTMIWRWFRSRLIVSDVRKHLDFLKTVVESGTRNEWQGHESLQSTGRLRKGTRKFCFPFVHFKSTAEWETEIHVWYGCISGIMYL